MDGGADVWERSTRRSKFISLFVVHQHQTHKREGKHYLHLSHKKKTTKNPHSLESKIALLWIIFSLFCSSTDIMDECNTAVCWNQDTRSKDRRISLVHAQIVGTVGCTSSVSISVYLHRSLGSCVLQQCCYTQSIKPSRWKASGLICHPLQQL